MTFRHKIKAQAMQLVLLVGVLVALILGAFLLLTHVQASFSIRSNAVLTAATVSHQLVRDTAIIPEHLEDTLTIPQQTKGSTKTHITYHGAWTKMYGEMVANTTQKIAKVALKGSVITSETPNLYLATHHSPLVVVGTTRVEGNSYIPKQGIKAGNIAGTYYQGKHLYYGRIRESATELPALAPTWVHYIKTLAKGRFLQEYTPVVSHEALKNSFYHPTQLWYDDDVIVLTHQKLSGNLVVYSATKIIITSAAQLEDVILIAPHIQVHDHVQGRMQLIATQTITIGKQCHFSYPSSVIVSDQDVSPSKEKPRGITIADRTRIEGALVYLNHNTTPEISSQIPVHIRGKAHLIGEVYCQGTIDFQGTIQGSLYAKQCITYASGSAYLNHLYHTKILLNPIPKYAGLPFLEQKQTIAQWLY